MKIGLVLTHKSIFGENRFYPLCETSKIILELMGRKSFTVEQLKMLRSKDWMIGVRDE